jgi:hypothetical protein
MVTINPTMSEYKPGYKRNIPETKRMILFDIERRPYLAKYPSAAEPIKKQPIMAVVIDQTTTKTGPLPIIDGESTKKKGMIK